MQLKQQLRSDLNASLKEGNQTKRTLMGMVLTSIKNKELEKRGSLKLTDPSELVAQSELTDDEVLDVLRKEVKKRNEAIEQFSAAGRADLAEKEKAEANMLAEYLPPAMDESELTALVESAIVETGASSMTDMGKVMAILKSKVEGRADGATLSSLVKKLLSHA